MDFAKILAGELNVPEQYVSAAIRLIDEGNTIPFIARYRKEATNAMDDQVLRQLADRLEYLRGLEKRKGEVAATIEELGAMTPELQKALEAAKTLAEVEDIYRPYKPKRKTRASVAKARGLEPLAQAIFAQKPGLDVNAEAEKYINDEVPDAEAALAGARDIIAEQVSDDATLRAQLRRFYQTFGLVKSKAAKEEDSVYAGYYDFSQAVNKIAGHRVLALDRGEREGFLKVTVEVDAEKAVGGIRRMFVKAGGGPSAAQVSAAVEDAYTRLIHPSLEREVRSNLSDEAAEGAIQVFGENLRQLLLQPPIKGKVALGMDPGYRMGCKLAVVDETGKVLDTAVVYPVPEFKKVDQAKAKVKDLIRKHHVQIIAIGNGTAGKETEIFAAEVIRELGGGVQYMVVSEAGASVYSASKLAAEEFPQFDVNLRSAVSIARRLQDPLAELVKIDPKAVGVGQYQHDMPQKRLNETLDGVVEDCVNSVGVDLNTASAPLLARVAGLSASTAKNVVAWREENGAFASRAQLKKVKGLGPKAFEQCAGFLRIPGAKKALDGTAVHPESYPAAEKLLSLCGFADKDIGTEAIQALPKKAREIGFAALCAETGAGEPTLKDIIAELLRPGRDMRDELPAPMLRSDVMSLEDLKPGMELMGTVRNVIDFGAFVDIGVHQDGLVHISQLSDKFIKHPSQAVKVGDVVKVKILDVDQKKKRISLTMKGLNKQ
ncbi:Tex family protein [Allofournierella massiliensis]|uniref:Tex family protein n=1 Tax=Allofournierella massiliensis TaxID=1650663 RepID=A0ABT7UQU2_9FIRM|nr:Tex family protein [Fournierella massiliensis]MDM8200708.1 Tex family protein [Fournierella massiliensis]